MSSQACHGARRAADRRDTGVPEGVWSWSGGRDLYVACDGTPIKSMGCETTTNALQTTAPDAEVTSGACPIGPVLDKVLTWVEDACVTATECHAATLLAGYSPASRGLHARIKHFQADGEHFAETAACGERAQFAGDPVGLTARATSGNRFLIQEGSVLEAHAGTGGIPARTTSMPAVGQQRPADAHNPGLAGRLT